jgi:putative ABC transport system permease protein
VVSFGLLGLAPDADANRVADAVVAHNEQFAAFGRTAFIENNLNEMETGILPVLWTIALFGAITGTAVLALLLYSAVQEQREDYAVLSAIGAPHRFLQRIVVQQALLSGMLGFGVGLGLYGLCMPLLHRLVPELELTLTAGAVMATFGAAVGISFLGSWAALRKLRGIYPEDVFTA